MSPKEREPARDGIRTVSRHIGTRSVIDSRLIAGYTDLAIYGSIIRYNDMIIDMKKCIVSIL